MTLGIFGLWRNGKSGMCLQETQHNGVIWGRTRLVLSERDAASIMKAEKLDTDFIFK
jgi:hypothetical protein